MQFNINKKIFEKWPEVKIGVMVLTNIDNASEKPEIINDLRQLEKTEQVKLTGCDFNTMPEIAVWKQVYRDFGSNPREYRSSVEALLRRVRSGSLILSINNLVDLYNFLSIKHHLPAGAEDIEKIEGDVELTFATDKERGKFIGGNEDENCYSDEVIYKDQQGFICRRWNWREADRTKIEKETKNAILVFEAMPPITKETLQATIVDAKELLKKYLGGEIHEFILDNNLNSIMLK